MTWTTLALLGGISLAGALGAVTRYLLGNLVTTWLPTRFPLGTFCINLSGAFLISFIFALVSHKALSTSLQAVLATGFLGGYTTFSTLNWEALLLLRRGESIRALCYLGGTYLLGLGMAALGLGIGGWLA
ncbi:hypothetical protein KSD_11300 [Ktedonobacter sp. SOSP1-85]|uniref:fluoride efflux transporter CrcB n=1 Tax=Ktedonobacter sp. SOSP1-85 TaxID=2778367 RepID=UPI0019150AA0|nr:fluoride efflux transporter CrcB [Ktedonobacter sp. SOSP1-85]GHO73359.1 hypothetical protein KSD_11300 [Ktedonobacter sp. SOSP1-85]